MYTTLCSSLLEILSVISINVISHHYEFDKCYLLWFYVGYFFATPNL